MTIATNNQPDMAGDSMGGCPVDHSTFGHKKSVRAAGVGGAPLEKGADGVWQVRGFEETRAVLRSGETRQAGFNAELINERMTVGNKPILYQEGKVHQEQRARTARFFTPKTVSNNYRRLMVSLSDRLVAEIVSKGQADLTQLSLTLAVQVASQIVGLTESSLEGRVRRLEAFFDQVDMSEKDTLLARVKQMLNLRRLLSFYFFDVRPAIRSRRKKPQEDVITHLIAQNYKAQEILTECVTYAAAGMATTREFIAMSAWHMLEHQALRTRYMAADEEERVAILHEILRLEPVVGHLYRRTTEDLALDSGGATVAIPKGSLVDLNLEAANIDERVVGDDPQAVCPGRTLNAERAGAMLMSFGDGPHRCPGAYVAIQETDIFLYRLMALEGLRIVRPPTLIFNELTAGYELRHFLVSLRSA
jgi:cytochrome P450